MDRRGLRFGWVLAGSLGLGGAAAIAPWALRPGDPSPVMAVMLSAAWGVSVAAGLRRFGRRGLWLLTGAPAAALWPVLFLALASGCAADRALCP